MKIRPLGVEFHADGQTYKHNEANSQSLSAIFANLPKNEISCCFIAVYVI